LFVDTGFNALYGNTMRNTPPFTIPSHRAIEAWLREEVVPVQQRVLRGAEKLISVEAAFGGLEARYRKRKAKRAR
jgi:hypothetical protein